MTLTRLIMRCIWLAMRERQGDSHENDGYIDSRSDAFVKRVYDAIDWSHLFERIAQMENEAITAAIDKLSDSMI